jgi:hypothetical protein
MNKVPLPTGRPYIMKSTKSCKLMQTAFSCDVQPPNHWCLPIRGDRKVAQPAPDIIWVLGMSAAFSDARMMNSFLHVWWDAMTQWRERAHETGYRRHGTGQPAEMHPRTHRGEVRQEWDAKQRVATDISCTSEKLTSTGGLERVHYRKAPPACVLLAKWGDTVFINPIEMYWIAIKYFNMGSMILRSPCFMFAFLFPRFLSKDNRLSLSYKTAVINRNFLETPTPYRNNSVKWSITNRVRWRNRHFSRNGLQTKFAYKYLKTKLYLNPEPTLS